MGRHWKPEDIQRKGLAWADQTEAVKELPKPARVPIDPFQPYMCEAANIPVPQPEHRFHPTRKWRFDYAWIAHKVAVETEGAVWVQGRHTRGAGYVADMEKYNAAQLLGWIVLRYEPSKISFPEIQEALKSRGYEGHP